MDDVRLDRLLVERGLAPSRERAQRLILAGSVLVDDRPVTKPGAAVPAEARLRLRGAASPYVSRGGEKLAGALDAFALDVAGRVALDVGASTGGFTDCLLRRGARRVLAVDVGYGQLAWALRQDARVTVLERVNARRLAAADLPETPDLATIDVAFISLALVLPAVAGVLAPGAPVVALVKPQFEVGRGEVGKGGVVRDPALRAAAVEKVRAAAAAAGLAAQAEAESVLPGPKGNREVFLLLVKPLSRSPAGRCA
ncbi:MAG TPA: TlyA family RNA methyltransferase [Candidatus Binatia bacterium]|nr:TlyA family RNA methyltransferase [Candidatus Binatia bacterium]